MRAAVILLGAGALGAVLLPPFDGAQLLGVSVIGVGALLAYVWFAQFKAEGPGFDHVGSRIRAALAGAGPSVNGALMVMKAALSPDVSMAPALQKVRFVSDNPADVARWAGRLDMAPGVSPVELAAGQALIHVLDERQIDAAAAARASQSGAKL